MDDRTNALDTIVALTRQHGLTVEEIAAALGQPGEPGGGGRWRTVLVRALGLLGATFIFAGIVVFIAVRWDDMGPPARVVVTLGSGLAAFVLAVLARGDARLARVSTPLFLMAAWLEPTGMFVAFDEFGSGGDWRWAGLVTSAGLFGQFAGTFASLRASVLLFMTVLYATLFWWTALDLANADDTVVALVLGGGLVVAAVGIDRKGYGVITPVWYLAGAAAFLYGFFDVVEGAPFELAFLVVAAGFVYLSVVLHSRTLLFVATLAILAYTGWFTAEHFADSVGWPLALIGFGIFMMGLSVLAFRIDRDYVREGAGSR